MMNFITADGDIYTLKAESIFDFDRLNDGEGGWSQIIVTYYDYDISYLISVDIPNQNV
jgi:hypothetical protein